MGLIEQVTPRANAAVSGDELRAHLRRLGHTEIADRIPQAGATIEEVVELITTELSADERRDLAAARGSVGMSGFADTIHRYHRLGILMEPQRHPQEPWNRRRARFTRMGEIVCVRLVMSD